MARHCEDVSFLDLTTLQVGGEALHVFECESEGDIEEALFFAEANGLPCVVLGEGSNVLPTDEAYVGVIIRLRTKGIVETREADGSVHVSASAGEHWDSFVEYVTNKGLWGVENLAGIPGSVGATPVQNIGAYGMDVSETIQAITVYDCNTRKSVSFSNTEAGFGYRDSRFKKDPSLIVLSVTFRLTQVGAPRVGYPDLRSAEQDGTALTTPAEIRDAVRRIRSRKFPDLSVFGTAGSFFKNPIIDHALFERLSHRYGAIPSFPHGRQVKVPLAFILDHILGLKGYRKGNAFLFGNQPLVLVADKGATANDIDSLACDIEMQVFEATGIRIEREVRHIFEHEYK